MFYKKFSGQTTIFKTVKVTFAKQGRNKSPQAPSFEYTFNEGLGFYSFN